MRKPGLLFNAEVPAQMLVEEDKAAIVEIRDRQQIKTRMGDRVRNSTKVVEKTQAQIHPDHLILIDNILSHALSHAEAVEILANMDAISDFGITHWQYIGGKVNYRSEWAKGAFYKYTVRKRFNIHRGTPGNSISEIFEIIDGESLPEQIFEPSNWTLDLETAEKYVNFARGQQKMYQIVKLTRRENSQWMVDEQIAVSV